ncbi:transposase [Prevotella sp.]|uniref:transposase n=1 Tax=Prevotella sp. TaxID=59823 RepID=UPI003F8148C4
MKALKRITEELRSKVEEVTLDFSESMHSIVTACFPKAMITLDRFHHQQFCLEAVQEVRIALRREEMTRIANERDEHRLMLKAFADMGEPRRTRMEALSVSMPHTIRRNWRMAKLVPRFWHAANTYS